MLGIGSPLHRRCPPHSPPPSLPPPRLHALSRLCPPHPFCAGRWVHKGVSAPTISAPPPFTHPFAQTTPLALPPPLRPPSCRTHSVSVPSPSSRKQGRKGGSAHPPPTHVQSACPALPCPLPCLALPILPRPARPPLCMHARGTGGTVHHPPPFPFPGSGAICPSCTPPQLHALHPLCTYAGGRAERASSLPSVRERAPPPTLPPLAYALPAAGGS